MITFLLFCRFLSRVAGDLQLFEIRYIWNLIANPMDLSLLKVNVKVIDSRSSLAETADVSEPAEEPA